MDSSLAWRLMVSSCSWCFGARQDSKSRRCFRGTLRFLYFIRIELVGGR